MHLSRTRRKNDNIASIVDLSLTAPSGYFFLSSPSFLSNPILCTLFSLRNQSSAQSECCSSPLHTHFSAHPILCTVSVLLVSSPSSFLCTPNPLHSLSAVRLLCTHNSLHTQSSAQSERCSPSAFQKPNTQNKRSSFSFHRPCSLRWLSLLLFLRCACCFQVPRKPNTQNKRSSFSFHQPCLSRWLSLLLFALCLLLSDSQKPHTHKINAHLFRFIGLVLYDG